MVGFSTLPGVISILFKNCLFAGFVVFFAVAGGVFDGEVKLRVDRQLVKATALINKRDIAFEIRIQVGKLMGYGLQGKKLHNFLINDDENSTCG